MTHVLVTVASKHGATHDIAAVIADRIRDAGADVVFASPHEVAELGNFDAAVIGSAVYAGRWMAPARRFVEQSAQLLGDVPVWLFSSGPLGSTNDAEEELAAVEELAADIGARDHHVFAGRLDRDRLNVGERMVAKAVGAPYGDFRNWADVEMWADAIADEVASLPES